MTQIDWNRASPCISALAASGLAVSANAAQAYDIVEMVEIYDRATRERCDTDAYSDAIMKDQIESLLGGGVDVSQVDLSDVDWSEFGLPWWYLPWTGFKTWMTTSKEDRISVSTLVVSSEYLGSMLELVNLSQEANRDDPEFRVKQDVAIKRSSELLELANCLRLSEDEKQWMSGWVRKKYDVSVGVMECGQWFDAAPELFIRLAEDPADTHLETFNDLIGWPTKECREGTRQ